MSNETKTNERTGDTMNDLVSLEWNQWDEKTVKRNELLLVETETENRSREHHTATFIDTDSGSLYGVVGGHFHFDRKIIRWASIQHLI